MNYRPRELSNSYTHSCQLEAFSLVYRWYVPTYCGWLRQIICVPTRLSSNLLCQEDGLLSKWLALQLGQPFGKQAQSIGQVEDMVTGLPFKLA